MSTTASEAERRRGLGMHISECHNTAYPCNGFYPPGYETYQCNCWCHAKGGKS